MLWFIFLILIFSCYNYCVVFILCLDIANIEFTLGMVLGDNLTKIGFRDLFGCTLGLEGRDKLPANRK